MWVVRRWLLAAVLALPAVAGVSAQHEGHVMSAAATLNPLDVSENRHGSGTAWLPDESPMRGVMRQAGSWRLMAHGQVFAQYISGSGDRGDWQFGSVNWVMGTVRHGLFGGQITGRGMVSGERLTVGLCGYPDLTQTSPKCGEVLRDRQHPHELFMELAVDYRHTAGRSVAFEVYAGLSGEPALGPVAYPHRLSASLNPTAPTSHHWLDVTHTSFGVVTGGVYGRHWKAEASAFNGRHADEQRYGFDLAPLNSFSGRFWWLPSPRWSAQVSSGRLRSPEGHAHGAAATDITTTRTTASVTYHGHTGGRLWATTVAAGLNREREQSTSALLAESTLQFRARDTLFGRAEVVEKTAADINFASADGPFTIGKLQAGYARALGTLLGIEGSLGGSVGLALLPADLRYVYAGRTAAEVNVFFLFRPQHTMTH